MTKILPVRIFLLISVLFFFSATQAQKPPQPGKWWIEFTDKNNSPFCTCRPQEFLSAHSLARRSHAGIPILEEDLPVNPQYLNRLRERGIRLHTASRWMNAACIIADSASALALRDLPFIKQISYLGRDIPVRNKPDKPLKRRTVHPIPSDAAEEFGPLGYSAVNLNPLATPLLHQLGARGNGIRVVVMDGGYTNADTLPHFDSLALSGRMWPGPDIVEHDRYVYEGAAHGVSVLAVMAANLPGYFVGAAPEATYFLLKTEDTGGEFPVEEANWIAGAEWADSIGAHIINASLGYTSFSDPRLNHTYAELDGRTALGSRGATIAARKGMLIFNSAGNSGDEPWKYIGVPADAPGIIAVGAVDSREPGKRAAFSSVGPTPDGRIKPDLVAPGATVVTAGGAGTALEISAGTSIASPILAGSVAALWSAFPEQPADVVADALFISTHLHDQPNNDLGYGLPDMLTAWLHLGHFSQQRDVAQKAVRPYTGDIMFLFPAGLLQNGAPARIVDPYGQVVTTLPAQVRGSEFQWVSIPAGSLPDGLYFVSVWADSRREWVWQSVLVK